MLPAMHTINHTSTHLHVALNSDRWVLSSAVLNGGLIRARHIVNMKVPKNPSGEKTKFDSPDVSLTAYSQHLQLTGTVVGLMTAASMTSFRQVTRTEQGVAVTALVTAGISNAKRAGEPAEWRTVNDNAPNTGTINIIILTNAGLTPAAMVEAVITVTEAKTVALVNLGIADPAGRKPATGTGTDAIAVAGGLGPPEIRYCGKHVLFGEMLGTTTIQALTQSLKHS